MFHSKVYLLFSIASFRIAAATPTVSVPSDLSTNFNTNSISLQVSYTNDSASGFLDGSTLTTQETSQLPIFALGDSSGVNTSLKFLILLLDTTLPTNRTLHYLQTDFAATEIKTGIASDAQPAFPYQAPGTLGEASGAHVYSFLLYTQPSDFLVDDIPSVGDAIDIESFQSANGLDDAEAGVAMVVDIGGSSNTITASAASLSTASGLTSSPAIITTSLITSTSSPTISSPISSSNTTTTKNHNSIALYPSSLWPTAASIPTPSSTSQSNSSASASASISDADSNAAGVPRYGGSQKFAFCIIAVAVWGFF
ncbi:MAG: hypothetical protein M1834_005376 [Cirrosporium novae-zelandiae]|nr:MAG: hypothetical protein M1834_005376 [Cirrosporium novae-zelandiae]